MAVARRQYQVAEKLRMLVAQAFQRAADERLFSVTVTSVVMSPDLRESRIYWVSATERKKELEDVIERSMGFIKSYVAKNLKLRHVPKLRFYYDDTLDTATEINRLLELAKK
jgi:ribosome-binding factor A